MKGAGHFFLFGKVKIRIVVAVAWFGFVGGFVDLSGRYVNGSSTRGSLRNLYSLSRCSIIGGALFTHLSLIAQHGRLSSNKKRDLRCLRIGIQSFNLVMAS